MVQSFQSGDLWKSKGRWHRYEQKGIAKAWLCFCQICFKRWFNIFSLLYIIAQIGYWNKVIDKIYLTFLISDSNICFYCLFRISIMNCAIQLFLMILHSYGLPYITVTNWRAAYYHRNQMYSNRLLMWFVNVSLFSFFKEFDLG